MVNVIELLPDSSSGIGIIFTNLEPHTYYLYSRKGRSQLRERVADDGLEFCYAVTSGDDPLGYVENPRISSRVKDGVWLSDQRWIELTYTEHYPDALRRISHSFGSPNSGHMHVTATDGWDLAPYYVAKHVLSGSHGSLGEDASLVPIMFFGPGVRPGEMPHARTVDILPTLLKYLGIDSPVLDGRALPIFADDALNQETRSAAASTFCAYTVDDDEYVYALEHIYASYDRRIVREDKTTGEREVLVESVKEALPSLGRQANLTLELWGMSGEDLILEEVYADQDIEGDTVLFDTEACCFLQ